MEIVFQICKGILSQLIKSEVLNQPDVKDTLHKLHTNYVLASADKAVNNVIVVCKSYYIDTLVEELGTGGHLILRRGGAHFLRISTACLGIKFAFRFPVSEFLDNKTIGKQ